MSVRPSSLPMLAQCPQFESTGIENADTEAGTWRHVAVREMLTTGNAPDLLHEDLECVSWATDYIRTHAVTGYPIEFEKHVNPLDDDFNPIFPNGGTLDLQTGPVLFDLKTRERDYTAQMAAYALGIFQETCYAEITVHVLYMALKRAQMFKLTAAQAQSIVESAVKNAGKGNPTACDYCHWCAKHLTCPAKLKEVNAVIAGREDWQLEQYHSSEIKTADEMGKALTLARHIKKWVEAVEFHAKEMTEKQGVVPTGYKVQSSKGKSFINDVPGAFQRAGVSQEDFLRCCDVRINSSKAHPEKVGLAEIYAKQNEIPKTRAAKLIKEKLSDVTLTGPSGIKLVALKGDATEETEGE